MEARPTPEKELELLTKALEAGGYDVRPEDAGKPVEFVSVIPIVEQAMRESIKQLTGVDIGPGEDDDAE